MNSLNTENKIDCHISKYRVLSFLKGNVTFSLSLLTKHNPHGSINKVNIPLRLPLVIPLGL